MARRTSKSWQRPPWAWALIGSVLGLLLAILLFAPARWLADAVAAATQKRLVLREPRGSFWSGSAQLLFTGGAGSTDVAALPTRLDWQLLVQWDGMVVNLHSDCCLVQPLQVRIHPRWGGVRIDIADSASQWPATLLAGLGTPWNTLQLDGQLQLTTHELSVKLVENRLSVAGQAEVQAQRLSSRLSTLRPMGSYRVRIAGGATPTLQLETLEGSLALSGSGQWVGSHLRFSGTASATSEHEGALSNLLNIIGRRNGSRSIITVG